MAECRWPLSRCWCWERTYPDSSIRGCYYRSRQNSKLPVGTAGVCCQWAAELQVLSPEVGFCGRNWLVWFLIIQSFLVCSACGRRKVNSRISLSGLPTKNTVYLAIRNRYVKINVNGHHEVIEVIELFSHDINLKINLKGQFASFLTKF